LTFDSEFEDSVGVLVAVGWLAWVAVELAGGVRLGLLRKISGLGA